MYLGAETFEELIWLSKLAYFWRPSKLESSCERENFFPRAHFHDGFPIGRRFSEEELPICRFFHFFIFYIFFVFWLKLN
jgi:hypothetical protein